MAHDALSQIFGALADPTRRAILARLAKGEASVSELAEPFRGAMSLPAITKHLKVLEGAGLISKTRDAQWRPCRLNGAPFRNVVDWVEQYRSIWEESFDRLEAYLSSVTTKSTNVDIKDAPKGRGKQHGQKKTGRRKKSK